MKFIALLLGLAVGFAGGIWYGINHPKEAADLNAKREEWVRQGKEEAFNKVRDILNSKVAQAESAPASQSPSGIGRNFAGGTTGGGGKVEAEALKAAKSEVEAQLSQVKAGK